MKVSELIELLKSMPQDIEVVVNDVGGGEVYPIDEVFNYIPNADLWPDDSPEVIIEVNGD